MDYWFLARRLWFHFKPWHAHKTFGRSSRTGIFSLLKHSTFSLVATANNTLKMKLFLSFLLLWTAATATTASANLRGNSAASRQLQDYYYSTTDTNVLGKTNKGAVLDNPMKGLLTSPRYTGNNTPDTPVPSTLEFYYIGLDEYVLFWPCFGLSSVLVATCLLCLSFLSYLVRSLSHFR